MWELLLVLTAAGLWKSYKGREVVRDVACRVDAGEVLCFLGPNGAGKTTTVGMLYGGVLPDAGTIQFLDFHIPAQSRQARAAIGIVTQEDNLDPDFDVAENLIRFACYYGITGRTASRRVDELIEKVGLQEHRTHKPDELSGGLKRRLVLARSLLNNPLLVFLDEPTTGLDPESRQEFWKLVTDLRSQGCGIVLTTHYMDEAQRLSDRLLLMQQGRIVDEGTPEELIRRVVGSKVAEIQGIMESDLRPVAEKFNAWMRPFGSGYILAMPAQDDEAARLALQELTSTSIAIRAANLEDVFLRLTGDNLD